MENRIHLFAESLGIEVETDVREDGRVLLVAQAAGTTEMFTRLVDASERRGWAVTKAELATYASRAKGQ